MCFEPCVWRRQHSPGWWPASGRWAIQVERQLPAWQLSKLQALHLSQLRLLTLTVLTALGLLLMSPSQSLVGACPCLSISLASWRPIQGGPGAPVCPACSVHACQSGPGEIGPDMIAPNCSVGSSPSSLTQLGDVILTLRDLCCHGCRTNVTYLTLRARGPGSS